MSTRINDLLFGAAHHANQPRTYGGLFYQDDLALGVAYGPQGGSSPTIMKRISLKNLLLLPEVLYQIKKVYQ